MLLFFKKLRELAGYKGYIEENQFGGDLATAFFAMVFGNFLNVELALHSVDLCVG